MCSSRDYHKSNKKVIIIVNSWKVFLNSQLDSSIINNFKYIESSDILGFLYPSPLLEDN